MSIVPRDLQHVLSKSYFAEKAADVQDKAAENKQAVLTQEMKQEQEKRSESVSESEEAEGKNLDPKEEKKRREEERKKRERSKEIARRLKRDTGHIIDLEA